MPSILSKHTKSYGIAVGSAFLLVGIYSAVTRNPKSSSKDDSVATSAAAAAASRQAKSKIAVDGVFFARLRKLLRIVIPGVFTPEMGFIVLVAAAMVGRTYCDLWMIKTTTAIESTIISRDAAGFREGLVHFFNALLPISCVTNLLKYGLNELALRFRTRLTNHLYSEYLRGFTYYKISNLDNRIANADQLLTQDLEKFCDSIADLYSNVSKPILDIFIYARKLAGSIGAQGPAYMLAYLAVSGAFLTRLRRPTGWYTVNEQRLEGEFRFVNSRLITNAEEIAFYNGNEKEKLVITQTFNRLVNMLRRSMQFRFGMGVIDSFVAKYFATIIGFTVVSRPFMDPTSERFKGMSHSEMMEDYYKSGRMLINLATAVGRLVLAGRELTRLAGFTTRMTDLMEVLHDLNHDRYKRTMVQSQQAGASATAAAAQDNSGLPPVAPNAGKIFYQDHVIKFENVPLVTPNGDILVRALSFEVKSGCNVLVAGPNGCGKSSLFRTLGELWPIFGGKLTKPAKEKLFYVPQRPYMTLGTLRDQVIYPHSQADLAKRGMTDADLLEFLKQVKLDYLADRENGWDAVQDWMDVLSGGEKQRVAMARLFYHRPQFAILDECTSAVSVDVEGFMYDHCRKLNITLFTVSHRKSLWRHHEYVLQFDGKGVYEYRAIDHKAEHFGS
ncbi:ATP-binding cassette [Capsaspora owczarzaki ATCC 30864]|uniref:ATP-binding cassette n=1 Tax=Capsaspora owczarzaki (strain ATCC 30864) TaxID=595528 RepID=A0A0D2UCF6_CAPO3|nr:ATP-binding cassette [Capsaspora owczarzaki ATCC 30864]KJE92701.1 ATP-binding cassette [Capsaspora owczarzaki ATCC 30864]|eukprot:XP_004363344.1 ATP-binding cassette [Capsaspora owczarzaki ATCC 30864]